MPSFLAMPGVGGDASGCLEILNFDTPHLAWTQRLTLNLASRLFWQLYFLEHNYHWRRAYW